MSGYCNSETAPPIPIVCDTYLLLLIECVVTIICFLLLLPAAVSAAATSVRVGFLGQTTSAIVVKGLSRVPLSTRERTYDVTALWCGPLGPWGGGSVGGDGSGRWGPL